MDDYGSKVQCDTTQQGMYSEAWECLLVIKYNGESEFKADEK